MDVLTNHGLVLLALAQDPRSPLRDVQERVGLTERAVRSGSTSPSARVM